MSDELKPCPFCNVAPEIRAAWHCQGYIIRCPKCESAVPSSVWGSRPIEDALRERIKVAVEALENIEQGSQYWQQDSREALEKIRG